MLPVKLLYFEVKSRHFQKLHVYPFELPQQLPGCGNFRKICSAEIDSLHKTVLHTFQIFEHAVINRFDCKKKIQKFANTLSFYPTGLKLDCLTLRAMVPNKESNFEQYQPMYSVTSKWWRSIMLITLITLLRCQSWDVLLTMWRGEDRSKNTKSKSN